VVVVTARRGLTVIHWATAVLHNGLGHYEQELAAAQHAAEESREVRLVRWGLVELIEAAARSGKPDLAADAHDRALAENRGQWNRLGTRPPRPARGRS
jgi:hypothetical protein